MILKWLNPLFLRVLSDCSDFHCIDICKYGIPEKALPLKMQLSNYNQINTVAILLQNRQLASNHHPHSLNYLPLGSSSVKPRRISVKTHAFAVSENELNGINFQTDKINLSMESFDLNKIYRWAVSLNVIWMCLA